MSHLVTIQTQVRDPLAVRAACRRLGLAEPVHGTHQLFAGQAATGLSIQLSGWRYPLVCKLESGELAYDNFNGHWGEQKEFDKFLQSYAVEKTRIEARKQGHTVTEQLLVDGSIKLTIEVGGSTV